MAEISLTVTKSVIAYALPAREKERQIAYAKATPEIASHLAEVSAAKHVTVRIGGLLTLTVADRGAIWRAHNDKHAAAFDALFALLAQYPSQPMRFLCEIVG